MGYVTLLAHWAADPFQGRGLRALCRCAIPFWPGRQTGHQQVKIIIGAWLGKVSVRKGTIAPSMAQFFLPARGISAAFGCFAGPRPAARKLPKTKPWICRAGRLCDISTRPSTRSGHRHRRTNTRSFTNDSARVDFRYKSPWVQVRNGPNELLARQVPDQTTHMGDVLSAFICRAASVRD